MSKKSKSTNKTKDVILSNILKVFNKYKNRSFNYKQLSKRLGIGNKQIIFAALDELVKNGQIIEIRKGKFKLKSRISPQSSPNWPRELISTGTVDMTASGAAYIIIKDGGDASAGLASLTTGSLSMEDVYISPDNIGNALHGDTVKVNIFERKGKKPKGEIIEIISRAKTEFIGIVQLSKNFAFLIPDNTRMNIDIFIPHEKLNGAKDGQKAIVKISNWSPSSKNPVGEIVRILGIPGDNKTEMDSIIAEYDFPLSFPKEVEKDAGKIPAKIPKEEIAKRRDFRNVPTFTIDPADAKDFDDALSIQKLKNGNWEIGIHIADVTYYVTPNSLIDKEAFDRATSIYLVDRVFPMLPERLSNEVCSLRPNEEKLCFSAVFEMNDEAKIINEWFGKTVIRSDKRFTYEGAQEIIEQQPSSSAQKREGPRMFTDGIHILNRLAKKLRSERFKNGSIAFDRVEVKFRLDKEGYPIGIYFKELKDSNKLIEDFMLLANRKVAEYVSIEVKKAFVYRVHDAPDEEKLNAFVRFISKFGYSMKIHSKKDIANSMNKLLKEVAGKAEANIIETLAIRTMSKAVYTTGNIGHYGLGFDHYTHFTSPIRRYPDMIVHRLLKYYLDGNDKSLHPADKIEEMCKHSSERERKAEEAERASVKFKQAQFLADKIGNDFEGIISGVTEWGIYIEIIENKCEGLVRLRDLDDDYYIFDEENFCIKGKKRGKKYRLGDRVKIIINRVDLVKKQLDFLLVS
ncbi:ribonuclease R [bacterium AH-315-M05]|nr:ribonuclease R [bacterium AH-315-M05]